MDPFRFDWFELLLQNMSNITYDAINDSQLRLLCLTVILNVVSIVLNGSCVLAFVFLRRRWTSRFILLTMLLVCYITQSSGMLYNAVRRIQRWANKEDVILLSQRECFLETVTLNLGSYLVQDTSLLLTLDAVFAVCFPVFYYCRYKRWILAGQIAFMVAHVAVEVTLRYLNALNVQVIVCTEYSDTSLSFLLEQARRDLCIIVGNLLLYLLLLWLVQHEHRRGFRNNNPSLPSHGGKKRARLFTLLFCELAYSFAIISGTVIDISLNSEVNPVQMVRIASFGFVTQLGAILNGVVIIMRLKVVTDFGVLMGRLKALKRAASPASISAEDTHSHSLSDVINLSTMTCFKDTESSDMILSIKSLPSN